MVVRFKDCLVFCSKCKRYLTRDNFYEANLAKSDYTCKECHRKYAVEYRMRKGLNQGLRRTKEEIEKETVEKKFLTEPYEEINTMVEKILRELGEYRDKGERVCGYCDLQAIVGLNGKEYCRKHFLIYCLALGKPLGKNSNLGSSELQRKLKILEELEKLGVNI